MNYKLHAMLLLHVGKCEKLLCFDDSALLKFSASGELELGTGRHGEYHRSSSLGGACIFRAVYNFKRLSELHYHNSPQRNSNAILGAVKTLKPTLFLRRN